MWRKYKELVIAFCMIPICHAAEMDRPRELSLNDAILLATRENPNVQQAQLGHVLKKFALEVQQWNFRPHFSFQATRTTSRNYSVTSDGYVTQNSSGISPAVSLLTPIGTTATLTAANNISGNYNPGLSLEVMQPLMRGFGRPIVEAALYDAIEDEKMSRLRVEGTLRETVTNVIKAWLDVMSAQNTLEIDQQGLKYAEVTEEKTKLFIKAGHKPGVELVTAQADVANAQARIENDKNNLEQVRAALLMTIGIDPATNVILNNINVEELIKKYQVPTLDEAKQMSLDNDIQYQIDQITLHGSTKRSVLAAEDNTRWLLNLSLSAATGNGTGGGPNAGINSLVNGVNQTNSATLSLTIPIDDRVAKTALANAKIALREAEIALQQEKWGKETSVISGWKTIYSAERALSFAQTAGQLQQKTYNISFQKYSHGLIDGLELQSALQHRTESQQAYVNAKISYLKALVSLDLLSGNTLKTWDVKIRPL